MIEDFMDYCFTLVTNSGSIVLNNLEDYQEQLVNSCDTTICELQPIICSKISNNALDNYHWFCIYDLNIHLKALEIWRTEFQIRLQKKESTIEQTYKEVTNKT